MKYTVLILSLTFALVWGCSTTPGIKDTGETSKPTAERPKEPQEDEAGKWFVKGLTAMNHGRDDDAEKYFLETLKLAPKSYNTLMYLGHVYENKRQRMKAVGVYQRAIELDEKNPKGYNGLMGAYLDMGLAREAIRVGEDAIRKGVPEEAVDINLGWSYYVVRDFDKAEERLKVAKERIKKDTAPANNLGLVYFSQGRYEEALECFLEAGRLNPASTLVPYFLAVTYNKLGDRDKVIESLKEGLKRDPKLESEVRGHNAEFFQKTDPGDLSEFFKEIKGGG